ncbi:MAG: chorismate synthase [Bacillota bacterium]|nr:chorismate synthase [Bacillota bacterium]
MSSIWGKNLKISLFGESHGPAIGVVMDGLPPGFAIDESVIAAFARRRAPGLTPWSTARKEADSSEILSGLYRGRTSGAPLCAIIRNTDTRSSDYTELKMKPRPGHADLTAEYRYRGYQDPRGSGHFSGRLTAPLAFAGAVCSQILAVKGVTVAAHIAEIAGIPDLKFNPLSMDPGQLENLAAKAFPVLDDVAGSQMIEAVMAAAEADDSVGGIVEGIIYSLPAGLGDPMFAGIESRLAGLLYGIPAVKGVEFGAGFAATRMRGSQHNDAPYMKDGAIDFRSNHSGGILGGISNGMPIVFRVAVKPPASIAMTQHTINLATGQDDELAVRGRHDPCIVPRVTPVIEAAAAVFALDLLLDKEVLDHD